MNREKLPPVSLKPGEKIQNFKAINITPLPTIQCVAYLLEHEKSGARLLHLHTNDPENLFAIALRTPPPDDTGLPHILEHTVLCGSKKYPVKDPFVELLKTSMATFLNAMTYPDKTVYPCASVNKKDFFNLASVYADAVFFPLLREEHFKQEGHHLEPLDLDDPINSPLIIKGIVYNEMKGAYSDLDNLISRYTSRSICPDTPYGHDAGGDPDKIPELTYDRFLEFHRTYYHPSNSLIFIYGNIPTEEHLKFLDENCLGQFSRIDIDTSIPLQPRWSKPVYQKIPYPIGPEDSPAKKSAVVVTYLTNDVTDAVTTLAMKVLDYYLLGNPASPLRKALIDSQLGEELTESGYADYQRDTFFTVGLKGTEPKHRDKIVQIIQDTIKKETEQGLDPEKLETAFHQIEMESLEIKEMYPLRLMDRTYRSWLYDADPLINLQIRELLEELRKRHNKQSGFFESILRTQLADNPHHSILTFVPDPELLQKKEEALKRKLAEIKAQMSEEELLQLAEEAKKLLEMQMSPNPPEALATLPRLSLKDVPKEPMELPTSTDAAKGIRFLHTDIFSNGLNYIAISIDLRGINEELIDYLPVYSDAVVKMGAGPYDYVKMAEREAAVCSGIVVGLSSKGTVEEPDLFRPSMTFFTKGLDRNLEKMTDILKERLLQPDFSDKQRLRDVLYQGRVARRSSIIPNGGRYAALFASRNLSKNCEVSERIGGVSQLELFDSLVQDFEAKSDELINKLNKINEFIKATNRITVSFVGTKKDFDLFESRLMKGLVDLPQIEISDSEYSFTPVQGSLDGLATPADVAFVAMAARSISASHKDAPVLALLSTQLSYGYLWERIRVHGGAYGARAEFNGLHGIFDFWSYRDPFIVETIQTFQKTFEFVSQEMDLSPKAVEQYIIGSIKGLDKPIRPDSAVGIALERFLTGQTYEFRKGFRQRLMACTGDRIKKVNQEILAPAFKKPSICVLSSREKLEDANIEGMKIRDL